MKLSKDRFDFFFFFFFHEITSPINQAGSFCYIETEAHLKPMSPFNNNRNRYCRSILLSDTTFTTHHLITINQLTLAHIGH